jgi:hypothetical protein
MLIVGFNLVEQHLIQGIICKKKQDKFSTETKH